MMRQQQLPSSVLYFRFKKFKPLALQCRRWVAMERYHVVAAVVTILAILLSYKLISKPQKAQKTTRTSKQ